MPTPVPPGFKLGYAEPKDAVAAFVRRVPAGNNPWGEGATTLEWTLSSPPPFHQFNELPLVK